MATLNNFYPYFPFIQSMGAIALTRVYDATVADEVANHFQRLAHERPDVKSVREINAMWIRAGRKWHGKFSML